MKHRVSWIAVACSCLLATASYGHKISFSGELWCPDLNNDGVVDFADVVILAPDLGTYCESRPGCPGDFNLNGYVGEVDLQVMLANLGTCPLKGDANLDGAIDIADMVTVSGDDGLDCHADLDHDGQVGGYDLAIAEEAWTSGLDHHPLAHRVDGDDVTLSVLDLLLVHGAIGRLCHSDANKDGHVNQGDFDFVCVLAGLCPAEP